MRKISKAFFLYNERTQVTNALLSVELHSFIRSKYFIKMTILNEGWIQNYGYFRYNNI